MDQTSVKRSVGLWLQILIAMVFCMVVIGGITRLTHSGLSIVEWKPIMGTLPPLSQADWEEAFQKYQQFPEYKHVNHQMSLHEFKWIFFWEYIHRLWGRLIGVVVFLPALYFMFRGHFKHLPGVNKQIWILFSLGGLQGLMGWFMVMSGLVDNPYVSHYRLTAHLMLALLIFGYLLWIYFGLPHSSQSSPIYPAHKLKRLKTFSYVYLALIVLQIAYGGLVAGLKAGFSYNTFPLMLGHVIPPGFFHLEPLLSNFFDNPGAVQFIHRTNAWLLFLLTGYLIWPPRLSALPGKIRNIILGLSLVFFTQFAIGIFTLLLVVPVSLGALHQAVALIVFGFSLYLSYTLYRASKVAL